jgi:hypothetical protein
MDAPPPDDVGPFLRIAAHLAHLGLSAPRIIAAEPAAGLVLEEDFGDALFSNILTAATAEPLLDAAVDALIVLHRAAPPAGVPAWDRVSMRETACGTLFDWWWPAMHDAPPPPEARAEITDALDTMLTVIESGPHSLVHRDFFAGNLIWLPQRNGPCRTGILDFQSAAIGHPAYDLVSLLQDARNDIDAAWERRAVARYLMARPEIDPTTFRAVYAVCAAQRHLRVACQWVRLAKRDGRPQYLKHGPRTWRLLTSALREPTAAPLAVAMDRFVPREVRRNPPGLIA